jgi:hypothetical protein
MFSIKTVYNHKVTLNPLHFRALLPINFNQGFMEF